MSELLRKTAGLRGMDDTMLVQLDLTYITERIIAVLFPLEGKENTYKSSVSDMVQMLKNKHGDNYMIINLSERRSDMHQLHRQVLDFGWPDTLSPPLERLCNICKTIESWLNSSPKNVAVIHCKGGLGRMAVVIAAYVDYNNICARDGQDLDQYAMKHFYEEKLARLVQPSQRRYVHYFAGLLSGAIKINNSSLFLHQIIIRGIPNFDSQVGCRPFIKIYQGMQPVYVSNVFTPSAGSSYICITLDPCLQLRSDVLVKCFNKSGNSIANRDVIFRCQFHTCAVSNNLLKFEKSELDEACSDGRFPDRGRVEFVFTSAPANISKPLLASEIGSSLDRWNSYENFAMDAEEKGAYTHAKKISTSSMQYEPKYKLDSGVVLNGTSSTVNSSLHSNTMHQSRSATVLDYGTSGQSYMTSSSMKPAGGLSHQMPDKTGNEQEQLDEILKELLGDHMVPQDTASLAPASTRDALVPASAPLLQGTITTESDSMRTTLSWQASQAGPAKSALVMRQTVAKPSPHSKIESDSMRYREMASPRYAPEVDVDKWGASERYFYEAPSYKESKHFDTRSETVIREEAMNSTSNERFLRPGEQPLRSGSPSYPIHHQESNVPKQRDTMRRTVSDHRRYASDSEDHVSWLEEQRSKLPSNTVRRRTWRQQLTNDNQPRAEMKSAQNAYYRSKRAAQSDTEDGATYDRHGYSRYGRSYSQDEPGMSDSLSRSYTYEHDPRISEAALQSREDRYQYNYEGRSHYPSAQYGSSHGPGYRPPMGPSFRASAPVSPVIPERGDSSREAVLRSQTNAREWLRSGEAYSSRYDEMSSPRAYYDSDVEMQRIAPPAILRAPTPHERTMSPGHRITPVPKLMEEMEEEVISLQPIGRGIMNLEPGATTEAINKSPLSAYPVSAVPMQQNGSQTFAQQQPSLQSMSMRQGVVPLGGGRADEFTHLQQPIQRHNFSERQEGSAGAQKNYMYESYVQHQQGQSSLPEGSCNSATLRGQPYFEMQGDRVQSVSLQPIGVVGVELHGRGQNTMRSGGYSYETMQQQQQLQQQQLQQQQLQQQQLQHQQLQQQQLQQQQLQQQQLQQQQLQQQHQRHFVHKQEQSSSNFIGSGPVDSRNFIHEMQTSPPLGSSVQIGRTQQDSMRRLNTSMHNLQTAESTGNGVSASSFYSGRARAASVSSLGGGGDGPNPTLVFIRDTSKFWHKEDMTREDSTAYLLDKPPGWFIVRNSSTFPGAFGLAVKVAQIPPNVTIKRDPQSELVRHFLIEPTAAGVQLKGNPIEPVFATLAALIYQHTLTPMALPLKLVLPISNETARFDAGDLSASDSLTHLAGNYAAFSVLYINSVDMESLTGPDAVSQAIDCTFASGSGPPDAVEVNLKVSSLGITLTDNRRRLFFRRHYPTNTLSYCGFEVKDRRWNFTSESGSTVSISRVFGFVARKQGSVVENSCHLFAELDPTHSSVAIVNTINVVMSGQGTLTRN